MNKRILLGIATLLVALLYACPADGGSTSGGPAPEPGINIEEEIKTKDPALVYKADTNEEAQALFSRGDLNNPYLFSFGSSTVKNLEAITGEITITGGDTVLYEETKGAINPFGFDARTDIQTSKTMEGMYMLDTSTVSGASIDAVTDDPSYDGTTYIVGIGPDKDNPIDYDTLTDEFSVHVKILHGGEVLKEETVQVSKAGRYDVTTWRDLQHISDNSLTSSYEVKNDIIFPEVGAYGYEKFRPIGYPKDDAAVGSVFSGTFDGNNYKIEGLYIKPGHGGASFVGLFGRVWDATIENITIYHRGISGWTAGGLLGYVRPATTIRNVHVYSMNGEEIVSKGDRVGGLIGDMGNPFGHGASSTQIIDSSAHTDVRMDYRDSNAGAGGLVGQLDTAVVRNSYATGNVYGEAGVGGLIGTAYSVVVEDIYATGNVEGKKNVGGLMGVASELKQVSSVTNVAGYATGDVFGTENVGGLVGYLSGSIALIGYSTGDVEGCDNVGGMAGTAQWFKDNAPQAVMLTGYSVGNVVGCEKTGGLVGNINARNYNTGEAGQNTHVVNGYARGKVGVFNTAGYVGSDIGLFMGYVYDTTRGKFDGYVARTTSEFIDIEESQVTGINGNSITISEVTNSNYEEKFKDFAFGDEVGQWTWEGNGKWPAINIGGTVPTADQPIASSSYVPPQTQEKPTDKSLEGIERLKDNVFKVYETHSWLSEKKRMKNRIPQADFYPTGLYIKPNRTITVTVASDTAPSNLKVLTGTYSRYEGKSWNPDTFALKVGKNTITNTRNKPRLIYIQFVERRRIFDVATVTIDGATKAPYFIRGKTTNQEFQSMLRNYDYDSILIASDRIMMVVSKETALQVQNQDWAKTADLLDKAVETVENAHGLDSETYNDTPPTTRILAVGREGGGFEYATHYRISTPKESVVGWIDNTKIAKNNGLRAMIRYMYER